MNIQIQVDAKTVRDALKEDQKQAPFALSLAINGVLKDGQEAVREGIRSRFTLRRPDFVLREGAKVTKWATKRDQVAELRVSEKGDFLAKFEDGGLDRPRNGVALAVPVAVRRNKNDIVPRSQSPRALLASKGAGAGRIFSANGFLVQVAGRGIRATTRILYAFRKTVPIPPLLRFEKTVNAAVDKHWTKRALEAVDRAIATKRS